MTMKAQRVGGSITATHLQLALRDGGWSAPHFWPVTPGKDQVPSVQDTGLGSSGPVWMARKIWPPPGFNTWTVHCSKSLVDYVILATKFLEELNTLCLLFITCRWSLISPLYGIWNNIKFKYKYRSQGDFPCSELFTLREESSTQMLNTNSAYHH